MDRFLTVNDSGATAHRQGLHEPDPSDLGDITETIQKPILTVDAAPPSSEGPCLYLGPQGQRCDRPAFTGGFCARHQPGAVTPKAAARGLPQSVAAGIGIAAVLWPVIFDVLRAIARWIHSH